jgi:hypothetical protein
MATSRALQYIGHWLADEGVGECVNASAASLKVGEWDCIAVRVSIGLNRAGES